MEDVDVTEEDYEQTDEGRAEHKLPMFTAEKAAIAQRQRRRVGAFSGGRIRATTYARRRRRSSVDVLSNERLLHKPDLKAELRRLARMFVYLLLHN